MALHSLRMGHFKGIVQNQCESEMPSSCSPDACNIDTSSGRLAVASGYVQELLGIDYVTIPGRFCRFFRWQQQERSVFLSCNSFGIRRYDRMLDEWISIHQFPSSRVPRYFDFLLLRVGSDERLLIACGISQLLMWDGSSNSVTLFGSSAMLSDMPQNYVANYMGRLFAAGNPDYPSRLYWSKAPGDTRTVEDWRPDPASPDVGGGHVEIGVGTDPITGIFAMSNQLLIFRRDTLYRLIGDRPSNYRILPVDAVFSQPVNSGCVLRGDRLFFLTQEGLAYYDGQTVQRPAGGGALCKLLKKLDFSLCTSAACGDKLYFAARENDPLYNDILIEYDVLRDSFMLRRGFSPVDLIGAHNVLYMQGGDGRVVRFDENSRTYGSNPIHAYWTTPRMDAGSKLSRKQLVELYLEARGTGLNVMTRCDKESAEKEFLLPDTPEAAAVEIPLSGQGRQLQLRFSNSGGQWFSIDDGVELLCDVQRRPL